MTTLVADAGGTYVRFALSQNGTDLSEPQKFKVADFPRFNDAVLHYLFTQRVEADAITAFYCAYSTRNGWDFAGGAADLPVVLERATFHIVNDFEANSYGLLDAGQDDVVQFVRENAPISHAPRAGASRASLAVIGAGTGLGLAYIIDTPHGPHVQPTHGGHMLPAILTEQHLALFGAMQSFKKTPSIPIYEDIISGAGIFHVYDILAKSAHVDMEYADTYDLIARGRNDPIVQQTLKIFHEMLGAFAHQVVAFGYSYAGLYLTGGVIDRLMAHNLFDVNTFYQSLLQDNVAVVKNDVENMPIYWIKDEFISLRGLLKLSQMSQK